MINEIILGDCLDYMRTLPDKCIDLVICDLPYGTTSCSWDIVIDFELLWEQYKRIAKEHTTFVLFGSQPFTTDLINSNRKMFKYELIWDKVKGGNIFNLDKMPMKTQENTIIFYCDNNIYNPIKTKRDKIKTSMNYGTGEAFGKKTERDKIYSYTERNPISILKYSNALQKGKQHPTQKPVELFEYLIKTYSHENMIVLDNCSGSGTSAVACIRTGRKYICIEKDREYYEASVKRVEYEQAKHDNKFYIPDEENALFNNLEEGKNEL